MSNTFNLDTSLCITHENEVYRFELKAKKIFQFKNLENGLAHQIYEKDFYVQVANGQISIIETEDYGNNLKTKEPAPDISPELKDCYVKEGLFRVRIIKKLQERGITKGQKIEIKKALPEIILEIEEESPELDARARGVSSVCRWYKTYEDNDKEFLALVPKYAFPDQTNKRKRLPNKTWEIIERVIFENYLTADRNTITTTYEKIETEIYKARKAAPKREKHHFVICSRKTIERHIYSLPIEERLISRYGVKEASRQLRLIKGHQFSEHALDVVEIDGTTLDLFLIDDKHLRPLGRPTVIFVIDRFSRVILGFYISFEGESLQSVFGALKASLYPNHLVNDRFPSIQNEWIWGGLGNIYATDNGPAFLNLSYQTAITSLGSSFKFEKLGKPWLRANIERFIRTQNLYLLMKTPGKSFSNLIERGGYDSQKDAILTLEQFTEILYMWLADDYHQQPINRLGPTRNQMWLESIAKHPADFPNNTEDLNQILGDRFVSTLNHLGLTKDHLHWASDDLQRCRASGTVSKPKIPWVRDRQNLGKIYVPPNILENWITVPSTRPDYADNLTLFQHRLNVQEARRKGHSRQRLHYDELIEARINIDKRMEEFADHNSLQKRKQAARHRNENSSILMPPPSIPNPEAVNWNEVGTDEYV